MEGPLSEQPSPLLVAAVNDAAAYVMTAVVLALAPWAALYDWLDLPRPDPPGLGPLAAAVLALAAVALATTRSRRAVATAATADVIAALAVAIWLTTDPANGIGTVILVLVPISLVAQAGLDVWALTRPRS